MPEYRKWTVRQMVAVDWPKRCGSCHIVSGPFFGATNGEFYYLGHCSPCIATMIQLDYAESDRATRAKLLREKTADHPEILAEETEDWKFVYLSEIHDKEVIASRGARHLYA